MNDEPDQVVHKYILYGLPVAVMGMATGSASMMFPGQLGKWIRWCGATVSFIAFVFILIGGWETRVLAQRLKKGFCPSCGYDLRASKDRCPECGREIEPKT